MARLLLNIVLLFMGGMAGRCSLGQAAGPLDDNPSFPDIWTVIEDSYDSDVLVTILDTDTVFFVEERYEVSHAMGCVRIVHNATLQHYNYYSSSGQMYLVEDAKCEVKDLYDHPGLQMYGWIYKAVGPSAHQRLGMGGHRAAQDSFVFGPTSLLRAARDYGTTFMNGTTRYRGIECYVWTTLLEDDHLINYAFAIDEWTMPYGHTLQGKTFRAPVLGPQEDPWAPDGNVRNMTVNYDYIIFNPFVAPEYYHDFLVDKGVDCSERKPVDPNKQTPPTLPANFQTQLEFIVRNQEAQSIFRARLYYDESRKLLRLDEAVNDEGRLSSYNKHVYDYSTGQHDTYNKHVYDYSTGVVYIIAGGTGACQITPIPSGVFGDLGSVIGGIIMADPDHLFHLDDSYVFTGYSETRGLLTERWTSTREDIPNYSEGGYYKKVVVDFQFLMVNLINVGEPQHRQYPTRMDITVYDDADLNSQLFGEAINFLDFSSSDESFITKEFDVRECYVLPQQRSWLKITFKGVWEHGLSEHVAMFERQLTETINMGAGVSFARMPELQLDHDDDYVFAVLLLLQPVPYLLQFTKHHDKKPTDPDVQIQHEINDVNICARTCLSYSSFECKSFYECTGLGMNCYVSEFINSTRNATIDQDCAYYVTTLAERLPVQPYNDEVVTWIESQIVMGTFTFVYTYIDQNNESATGEYIGESIYRELLADDPLLIDYLRDDFLPVQTGARIRDAYNKLTVEKLTYVECLLMCETYLVFRCETFSFCYNSGTCYLSDVIFVRPMISEELVYQSDCNVVTRQLIDDYTRIEGAILTTDVNQKVDGILDPNYCAYLCDMASDFVCRSFDYCTDSETCYMHETHSLDGGEGSLNLNNTHCTHYSRDYLVDFVKHENVRISGKRDVYIEDNSVGQCAKECIDMPNVKCNGFDYCQDSQKTICFLTENQYSGNGVPVTDDITCDHYERVYYDGQEPNKTKTKKMYGPGDMAVLALFTLAGSAAVTVLCVYLFYMKA